MSTHCIADLPAGMASSTRDDGNCWIWTGSRDRWGYGVVGSLSRSHSAHRTTYEAMVGPIPPGLVLDHLCRVRACCNPGHLEPVTQRENVLRSPVALAAINARKTHCPQGHEYDFVRANGKGRGCLACQAASQRAYQARKRESA